MTDSQLLPTNLSHLVSLYSDGKTYSEQEPKSELRLGFIQDELQYVPTKSLLKYKMAYQLAENHIKSTDPNFKIFVNPDVDTVAGIFLSLLGSFSYEQLLNPGAEYVTENLHPSCSLIHYIDKLIIDREYEVCAELSSETHYEVNDPPSKDRFTNLVKKIKHNPYDHIDEHFKVCRTLYTYFLLSDTTGKYKSTISWREYEEDFIAYIEANFEYLHKKIDPKKLK